MLRSDNVVLNEYYYIISDAKQILSASPRRTGGDHQDVPVVRGWRQFSRTWNQWTWTKQSTWLRIVHSGDWYLRLAIRTHSGACQKRTNVSFRPTQNRVRAISDKLSLIANITD